MPDTSIHEEQASHNYLFLKTFLKKIEFRDWQVTVAFYTALHIMECQLNKKNQKWRELLMPVMGNRGMHAIRETAIQQAFSDVYKNYKMLSEKSRTARYFEGTSGDKVAIDILSESDVKELINRHLKAILDKFNYSWR